MNRLEFLHEEIKKTFEIMNPENNYMEIRILHSDTGTLSGYFNSSEAVYNSVKQYDGIHNVFFTLNRLEEGIVARSKNRLKKYATHTTTDKEISQRKWILLDFDPVRPAGISSSDKELNAAKLLAEEVKKYLKDRGFPYPVTALSGNGYHLLYFCELRNGDTERELVKSFLESLNKKFSNDEVKLDKANFNAARICKLYGTIACKGDSTEERPHRRSKILSAPKELKPVGEELIKRVIDELDKDQRNTSPKKQEKQVQSWKRPSVKTFLSDHGLEISREKSYMGGICYVLETCPFNSEHTDSAAYVIEFPNGKICAGCHHDSCSGKGWKDLLELYPDQRMIPPKRKKAAEKEEGMADTILKNVKTEQHKFFYDEAEKPYVCVSHDGIEQYLEVCGSDYEGYVRYLYYDLYEKAIPQDVLRQVLATLAVKALREGDKIEPAYRCAYREGKVYYFLADREQTVICIDKDGYRVVEKAPVPFIKKKNMLQQVLPKKSEMGLEELGKKHWSFATSDDRIMHWVLIISRFIAEGSQPIIYYFGDRGSAKTTSMKMDRMIVDPSVIDVKSLNKRTQDVIPALTNQYMVCFDNVSSIGNEFADILCIAATHGYYSKRALYSDNEEYPIKLNARVSLSGITNLTMKPDLIDRMVCLKLNRIDSRKRRTEAEVMKEFTNDLPFILDGIFLTLSKAMRIYEKLELECLPRMADFAQWGYAIAEALGNGGDRFLKIYEKNQNELLENLVSEDTVLTVLIQMMKKIHYYKGSVTKLQTILTETAQEMKIDTKAGWIRDASSLSRKLCENQSVLNLFHISIHKGKTNGERYIELYMDDESQETE